MSFTEEIYQRCPHCDHKDNVKGFTTWEKDGKRGLLGKTPDGFIMILCPNCNGEIKYDTLGNKFLKPEEKAKSTFIFNFIFWSMLIFVAIYMVRKFVEK